MDYGEVIIVAVFIVMMTAIVRSQLRLKYPRIRYSQEDKEFDRFGDVE